MQLELFHDPYKKHPYLFTTGNEVDWKGTPGVGDILFGLNAVHMMVHMIRKRRELPYMNMNVYWNHDKDFLYHFEDPETIIERADYLHNFYYDKSSVRINHIFNSKDREIVKLRHRGFQRERGPTATLDGIPSWLFRKDVWCDKPNPNKVVFWRPLFNKEEPPTWKRAFTEEDWDKIISILQMNDFELVELTYRTPVREALYHIRTCRFCVFYDGMWQYIAKNLCKPVIALGASAIIEVHNPQGVHFNRPNQKHNDFYKYMQNIRKNLSHLDSRANRYKKFITNELEI